MHGFMISNSRTDIVFEIYTKNLKKNTTNLRVTRSRKNRLYFSYSSNVLLFYLLRDRSIRLHTGSDTLYAGTGLEEPVARLWLHWLKSLRTGGAGICSVATHRTWHHSHEVRTR